MTKMYQTVGIFWLRRREDVASSLGVMSITRHDQVDGRTDQKEGIEITLDQFFLAGQQDIEYSSYTMYCTCDDCGTVYSGEERIN